MGYLVLQGGSEFYGEMEQSDRRAISLAGGLDARISIIPTAAAPDDNHHRAGKNGCMWFRSLGARNVTALPIVDRASANDPDVTELLEQSDLIYLLGGFPEYLAQTMAHTSAWRAITHALSRSAVVAGSSAGAMVLCDRLYEPGQKKVVEGLGLLPACCVLPHHDTFGQRWAPRLQKELPGATLIGIDEQTGVISDGAMIRWTVYGGGSATLYRNNTTERYLNGSEFSIQPVKEKS